MSETPRQSVRAPLKVSFIVPTFNSARTLRECLAAIRAQEYPADRIELVIADAGSSDDTVAIAREFRADRIVPNPLQTGEAGKAAAIEASSGDVLALVDSDNVLDSPRWLAQMLAPFADGRIEASEPLWYTRRDGDPELTRYFAMLGMNDPVCLFLGNYDRMSLVTNRWTGLDVPAEDRGDYLDLTLSADQLPTIGANGFVMRRSLLAHVTWKPYFFDIDIMHQAIAAGHRHVAKVRCGIVHLYGRSLGDFARKQDRRIRDFLFFSADRGRTYPWSRQRRAGLVRFCLCTALVAPLLLQMARGWCRKPDRAWRLHVPVCWITLAVYARAVIARALGRKPQPKSRDRWRQ